MKFQPIKRPQAQQKKKAKTDSSSSTHKFSSSVATASTGLGSASSPDKQPLVTSTPSQQPSVQRSNFADWVGDDGDGFYYDQPKNERGGRKGRKNKNKKNKPETISWEWGDIYDPALPNLSLIHI